MIGLQKKPSKSGAKKQSQSKHVLSAVGWANFACVWAGNTVHVGSVDLAPWGQAQSVAAAHGLYPFWGRLALFFQFPLFRIQGLAFGVSRRRPADWLCFSRSKKEHVSIILTSNSVYIHFDACQIGFVFSDSIRCRDH